MGADCYGNGLLCVHSELRCNSFLCTTVNYGNILRMEWMTPDMNLYPLKLCQAWHQGETRQMMCDGEWQLIHIQHNESKVTNMPLDS